MTSTPAPPTPDDKDWTFVLSTVCTDCGYDPAAISFRDVPGLVRTSTSAIAEALERPEPNQRPSPEVWSPLEYACHVRDVCRIFGVRLSLMRGTDDPLFANWDQDATAIDEQYWAQDPLIVSAELRDEADRIAADFDSVRDDELDRPGRRSNGSEFTVDSLARYFIHDLIHHAHDIAD